MMRPDGYHPDDSLHVILDALKCFTDHLGTEQAWRDYEGNDDDPKATEGGYRAVVQVAQAQITDMLNISTPLPQVPE